MTSKKSNIPLEGYTNPWDGWSTATESQGFGGNPDDYKGFGLKGHNGHDDRYIKVNNINPAAPVLPLNRRFIRAIEGGIVVRARWDDPNSPKGGFGQYVRIYTTRNESKLNLPPQVAHIDRVYGHMGQLAYDGDIFKTDGVFVKEGQRVEAGQIIGIEGSTGNSTGQHLHRGRRYLDVNYQVLNYDNGYFGYEEAYDDLLLNENMSNAIFVHKKGTSEYGWYLPKMTEEANKDMAMNLGREDVIKPDGTVDFSRAVEVVGL